MVMQACHAPIYLSVDLPKRHRMHVHFNIDREKTLAVARHDTFQSV